MTDNNVFVFPKSPNIKRAEAEEYLRTEMRMQLAAACSSLQGPADKQALCDVLDRMANVAMMIDSLVAIRKACE